MWKSLQDPLLTLGIILRIMTYDRWIKSENVDEVELEIGQWSGITREFHESCKSNWPHSQSWCTWRVGLSSKGSSIPSSTSRRYRLPRIYLVRPVSVSVPIFAIQKRTIWNIYTRMYDPPTKSMKKNQRGIGISVPIRRLEAVRYSKRSFENLKSKSKKSIEL